MSTTNGQRILQPYLFFDGRCEEALDFYRKALGAEVTALMRFKDSPEPSMACPGAKKGGAAGSKTGLVFHGKSFRRSSVKC